MDTLTIRSPAKLNLALRIVGKRPDGYHELQTIMQKISLYDEIELTLSPRQGISVTTDDPLIPNDERNLAYQAARTILEKTRCSAGVVINIRKSIPAGAGLGGGSSNAAAVLTGLNTLLGCKMTGSSLKELGITLGADVPFFIYAKNTALASGIGERLRPVKLDRPLWFIVIYPGFSISTAWAYRNYKLLTNKIKHIKLPNSISDVSQILHYLVNDLEQAVVGQYPEIEKIKKALVTAGAYGSLMSGSGSSVFGVFLDRPQAEKTLSAIPIFPHQKVFIARSLVD